MNYNTFNCANGYKFSKCAYWDGIPEYEDQQEG